MCPAFKDEVKRVYENHVVEQNAIRQAIAANPESDLTVRNVRFMDSDDVFIYDASAQSDDTEQEERKIDSVEQLEQSIANLEL